MISPQNPHHLLEISAKLRRFARGSACLLGLAIAACGQAPSNLLPGHIATGCSSGSALVGVFDSYLMIQCGCDESAGSPVHAGSSLTCTVPAGTSVVFQYFNGVLKHQILPGTANPNAFVAGPIYDPQHPEYSSPTLGTTFTTTGTYTFFDAFNTALSGQIVVR